METSVKFLQNTELSRIISYDVLTNHDILQQTMENIIREEYLTIQTN